MPRIHEVVRRAVHELTLVMEGPLAFQLLCSAHELGLFALLSRHPGIRQEQARKSLRLPGYSMRVLASGCCAFGWIEKDSRGGLRNQIWTEELLVRSRSAQMRLEMSRDYAYGPLAHLSDSLRQGTNVGLRRGLRGRGANIYDRAQHDRRLNLLISTLMGEEMRELALTCTALPELSEVRHLADIGGSSGALALALARRFPSLVLTVYDLPATSGSARRRIRAARLSRRVHFQPGNFFKDPLPDGVDAHLFCRVFTNLSPDAAAKMTRRSYRALPPGGRVFIQASPVSNDAQTGPLQSALWSVMSLGVTTGTGFAHSWSDYTGWLRAAGFRRIKTHPVRRQGAWFVGQK